MIYASCRRPGIGSSIVFDNTLAYTGDSLASLKDKRVLVIVHGTANTKAELVRLAGEIESRNPSSFDSFVMFAWPGGVTGVAYLVTKFFAVRRAAKFLEKVLDDIVLAGAKTIDIDAHSLGVPIALEATLLTRRGIDGLWLKAGACGRNLSKYRSILDRGTSVHVFYSPQDLIVGLLYPIWFGFGLALGHHGEKTSDGNIGTNYDVSAEISGSHIDYRRCSIVVQAMRNEAERRLRVEKVLGHLGRVWYY